MTRRLEPLHAVAIAALAAVVAMLIFVARTGLGLSGDTIALVSGTHTSLDCIGNGTWKDCGDLVAQFPLLQYLPATVFIKLGMSDQDVFRALSYLNTAAFGAMLVIGLATLRRLRLPVAGVGVVLVLLASPLLWYSWSTLGESLAACAWMAFVAAALLRAPAPVLALSLALAGISKETALPFLVVLGVASLLWTPVEGRPPARAQWYALGAGAVLSLVLTGAFNEFRYGTLDNQDYWRDEFRTPGAGLKARFALSVWLAPNGGLAIFWPLAVAAFVAMLAVAVARLRAWRDNLRVVGGGAALLVCLLANTYGLASWYAPFGWQAWGPRLWLLMVPAMLLFGAALMGPELERLLRAPGRWAPAALGLLGALAVATVLTQVGVLFHPQAMPDLFLADDQCPAPVTIGQPALYYHCIIHFGWYKHWILLDSLSGVTHSVASVSMTAVWLIATGVVATVAVRLGRTRPGFSAPPG